MVVEEKAEEEDEDADAEVVVVVVIDKGVGNMIGEVLGESELTLRKGLPV